MNAESNSIQMYPFSHSCTSGLPHLHCRYMKIRIATNKQKTFDSSGNGAPHRIPEGLEGLCMAFGHTQGLRKGMALWYGC